MSRFRECFSILRLFRPRCSAQAYQAARKHLDDLDAAATMKRRLEERHDRAEVKALEAFQQRQSQGPVRAKRALDGCKCGKIPQLIRLEGERITFGATFDEKKVRRAARQGGSESPRGVPAEAI